MSIDRYYNFAAGSFHTKKLCRRLYFFKSLFEPTLGDLGATYHFIYSSLESPWSTSYSSWLNFFAVSNYGWHVIGLSGNLSKLAFFEAGVTLNANIRRKGTSSTNRCWCQKTRVNNLSCGIKIAAVHCLVLSQACVWRTDRRIELRQLIAARAAKSIRYDNYNDNENYLNNRA